MRDSRDLQRRVDELERQVAALGGVAARGVRYRSSIELGGLPLVAIASGPDSRKGEARGHAVGVIAIGDMATGVIAIGGLARGIVALGGLAVGGLTFGGMSIGALVAFGGLAIGTYAFGGGAVGYVAVGGGAAGVYACGGDAAGDHVITPVRRDPEAVEKFAELGLGFCGPRPGPRAR